MFLGHLGVWKPVRSTTYSPIKDRTQAWEEHSKEDPLQILIDYLCTFSWRTICCLYKGLLSGSEASQNEHIWWVWHPDEKARLVNKRKQENSRQYSKYLHMWTTSLLTVFLYGSNVIVSFYRWGNWTHTKIKHLLQLMLLIESYRF